MTETKVRYGILSAATIVPRFAKGMRLTSNGEVTAIAARSLSKTKETARELDIPNVYPDYASLLESDEVDAVYIPLVNSLHYEYTEKALKAGKHAIVEKPFVLHAADAEKLFETASEKGLFITEAIKTAHLPLYQKKNRSLIQRNTGGSACLNVSTRVLFQNGLTIYMDHAVIEIPDYWKAGEARIIAENGSQQLLSFPCSYEFRYELEHYNSCILSKECFSTVNTPEMTMRYIRFCEDLYNSF